MSREGTPFAGVHPVYGQPRPVPDRTMLKPCMRPDTPCREWMPTSPSTYGQGLARPARPQRPPVTFPLGGGCENEAPVTKNRKFVTGARDRSHVTGRVTRWRKRAEGFANFWDENCEATDWRKGLLWRGEQANKAFGFMDRHPDRVVRRHAACGNTRLCPVPPACRERRLPAFPFAYPLPVRLPASRSKSRMCSASS